MAYQDLASVTALLKENWGAFQVTFNTATVLLDRLSRLKEDVSGEDWIQPRNRSGNPAVASFNPDSANAYQRTMVSPGRQGYNQALFRRAHVSARFGLTGSSIDASNRGGAAVADVLTKEIDYGMRDASRTLSRMLYGDGSGLLGKVTSWSTPAGNVVLVMNSALNEPGNMYVEVGQEVDVIARTDGALVNGGVTGCGKSGGTSAIVLSVSGKGTTTQTVTLTGAVSGMDATNAANANFGLYLAGTRNLDPYGFLAIMAASNPTIDYAGHSAGGGTDPSGLYGRIDRSVAGNEDWIGNVISASGTAGVPGPIDVNTIQRCLDVAELRGDGKVSAVLMDQATWRTWGNTYDPSRRWAGETKRLSNGWQYIDYLGIPFIKDIHCPPNQMFFVDESKVGLGVEKDLSLWDYDDSVLQRVGTGPSAEDKLEGTLIWRGNMMTGNCAAHCVLRDIAIA